ANVGIRASGERVMKNRAGNVLARPISPPSRGRIRLDETHREAVERIHAICGKRPSPVDGYFNGLLSESDRDPITQSYLESVP
ncbi:hypothetical protein, partial [Burkholderia gladioli]|uniref:hypothetical protein n=2 Tax=Burkholderia gladioli TaxID=28095 RepID=UPI001ABB34D7